MKSQGNRGITKLQLRSILAGCLIAVCGQAGAASISTVTDTRCNSKLEVTISSTTRSSAVSATSCQDRVLAAPSAGFTLNTSAPGGSTTPDSKAMESAGYDAVTGGGGLYEAYVATAREAAVLFTPNNALMMSRSVEGVTRGVGWNMGLAAQPVTGGTNAWLIGTYALLRANNEMRVVDAANQTNAGLSEVFDPATLRITFNGQNTANNCSITNYSSWLGYSLTTDPAGISGQDGTDYALHQAVYAGEGYAGIGGVHKDSVHTFTACDYTLSNTGLLFVTYEYTDGSATARSVENSYYVSSDLRYLVSTVDASTDIFRGFEVGVRVKTISGTQDERNDGVAGTYLFNSPAVELQGATSSLATNVHLNAEKITHCMSRGAAVLSTTSSATAGWNTCTWNATDTCSVQGQDGKIASNSISIQHYAAQGSSSAASCRYQVASDGSLSFVVNLDTAEGAQDIAFSGAMADNNETLILRGKYVGTDMTDPSATSPQRKIKNDLVLSALVGFKHSASLVDDPDNDGLNNLAEFLYPGNLLGATTKNDYNNGGIAGWIWKGQSNGRQTLSEIWRLGFPLYSENWAIPNRFYPPPFADQTNWELVTSGDFNKDGDADIIWRHKTLATWKVWQMQNGQRAAQNAPADFDLAHDWTVVGAGDTDKDGDDDVILNKASTGEVMIWQMQNHAVASTSTVGTKAGYLLNRIGDFDADGDVDLLLRQSGGDVLVTWELQSSALVLERALSNTGVGWNPVCAGDFDADGDDDIMLMSSVTTQEKWFVIENFAKTQAFGSTNVGFVFQGCGDYDGDGDADIKSQRSSDDMNRIVLQQNVLQGSGVIKQTVYTNPYGGVNSGADGYGFVYRANSN